MKNFFRKARNTGLIVAVALCLAVPLITTCENSSSDNSAFIMAMMVAAQQQQQQQQAQQSAPQPAAAATIAQTGKTVTFTGSVLGSYGAMPAKAAALVCPELALDISQSASPDLSGSGYEWFANATSGGVTVEGSFVAGSANRTFEIPLEVGKTWNITCGIRVAGGGAAVMADTYPFNATEENTILSRAFIPEPVSDGNGSMELKMTLDSSSNAAKVTAFCASDDWPVNETTGSKEWPLVVSGGTTATLSVPSLKRGIYDVSFNFFATSDATGDVFLYTTVQTVNVLANAKSDTWALGGGEGTVTDGKLVINAALIAASAPTVLYVGDTGAPGAKAQSDSNAGGAYAPLASLSKAAQIIEATASGGSKNYKVYVKGAIDSDQTADFPASLDGKAASITIAGLSQTASGAEPSDKISGGKYPHGAITVKTKVPVTIKNLAISESYGDKGGAIYAKGSGVKVTLENGALIKKCHASYGGGVCVEDGATLVINEGAKLVENYTNVEATSDDADTYGGFAVYASGTGATVTMNGGEISQNNGSKGNRGAVKIASGAVFNFNDGKIADNNTQKIAANVYINSGVMSMKGGEISGGKALKNNVAVAGAQGGGVYLAGTGKLDMSGGKIENNDFSANENSLGGGIYVGKSAQVILSGGASVPCGTDSSGKLLQKNNDVYLEKTSSDAYSPIQVATGFSPSVSGKIGVTADNWVRKAVVVKSSSGASISGYEGNFDFTAGGVTMSFGGSDNTVAKLIAPYYVAADGVDQPTTPGTEDQPYKTISFACGQLTGGDNEVINIKGSIAGDMVPSSLAAENCASLTLRGSKGLSSGNNQDKIDAGGSGMALTVSTRIPVKVEKLKITGGGGVGKGAGIYVVAGANVTLGDGALVTGNTATAKGGGVYVDTKTGAVPAGKLTLAGGSVIAGNTAVYGGGVFLDEEASLFMYGSAIIGDDKTDANYSNRAYDAGGGIYCEDSAKAYLGYTGLSGATPVLATGANAFTGGVCHNLQQKNSGSGGSTGGIFANIGSDGVLYIAGGNISYNEGSSYAGGIYVMDGASATISGSTVIKGNKANQGGGIYISGGSLTLQNGSNGNAPELLENVALSNEGGAIYNSGSLSVSGKVYIPYVAANGSVSAKNDVYLASATNFVTVDGNLSLPTGKSGANITITPYQWKRGDQVLDGSKAGDNVSRFATIDTDFSVSKESAASGVIDADIVVKNGGKTGTAAASARGTYSDPYGSVADAIDNAVDSKNTTITIKGSVAKQSISSWPTTGGAASVSDITLAGYMASGAASSDATIDANSSGSALTVDASGKTVTITNIKITKGSGTSMTVGAESQVNGGGICLKAGTVKLGDGALITGNAVANNGGGVYVAGGAKLFMYGSALIGDSATSTTPAKNATAAGSYANKATNQGGGIYCEASGTVCLGYSAWTGGSGTPSAMTSGYGVRRNYAGDYAGGIYSLGTLRIKSGHVSYNASGSGGGLAGSFTLEGGEARGNTATNGAGIYVPNGSTAEITSGTVAANIADYNGGAAYVTNSGTLKLSGGTISANEAINGGGVFTYYYTATQYGTFEMSGGTLTGNKATGTSGKGGAVYNAGTFSMTAGAIGEEGALNTAGSSGGAVYQNGTFNMNSSAVVFADTTKGVGEKNNDVKLESGKYIIVNNSLSGSGKIAAVTPYEWGRGKEVIAPDGTTVTSITSTIAGRFAASDSEWSVVSHGATTPVGKLDADLWVSEAAISGVTGAVAGDDTNGRGTKAKPYATIQKAASQTWKTGEATINVSGTLKATGTSNLQNIPASGVTATSINLAGTNSATINANSKGSALTVNGNVVTITNIKFTGGSGTSMTVSGATQVNGGGIYLKAGTLKLGDDVVVTGNTVANNGGGVYVASGASLFMYGKALIGDSAVSTTRASNSGTSYYANKAANGGGIYNAGGSVYIGYDAVGNQKSLYSTTTAWYGVRRNVATTQGAGIYHHSGTLLIASGDISYNFADTASSTTGGAILFNADATISGGTFTSNKAGNGGALAINSGKKVTIDGAATFKSNAATLTGGAVYNNGGTFTMSAGTIGASGALNTAGNQGGAIYQNGTFYMSGSAVVYADTSNGVSEKNNDVQLTSTDKYITVNGSLSASSVSGYSMIAAVTPSTWKRGNQVIAPDGTNVSSINSTIAGRFAVSDSEWSVRDHSNVGKLNAELWVAGTGYDSTGGVCATKAAGNSNRGTKKQPYASIQTAAEKCWTTDLGFTINISGMVSGSTQTIPAANSTAGTTLASKITLQGSSNTTDGIDRGLASATSSTAGASALIINYLGYVDITNLKIMGGNTTGNGGGIQINGPSTFSASACPRVNLKAGTLVQQNKAKNGGGVYSSNSILCLYGTATIGNDGALDRSASNTALTTGINIATTAGGGIYSTGGRLYLGAAYVSGAALTTNSYKLTKGVYANVCTATSGTSSCGGIYNNNTMYFYTGNIDYNYGPSTGGVYNNSNVNSKFYMQGGTIHKNAGAGVYNDTNASFWMSGDAVIGDSETASRASSSTDCSNSKGGLINAGTARLGYSSGTTKSKLSGGIYRNYLSTGSKNDGGAGIKNTGTLYFDSGTISYNYAYCTQSQEAGGGGIFSNSTVYMTSSSSSQYSCVKDNKCSEAGGGIYLDGSSAKLLMSGYAIIGKAGQTTPPSSATAAGANTAKYGAGIGSSGGATICLGYSSFTDMDTNTTESLDNGGICYNYATINGGGIYCQGNTSNAINVYIASGKINANKVYYTSSTTYGNGGGMWANMYATIYMGGGQISKNSASTFGGGIFTAGKLFMYGTALIGDTGSSVATTGNYGNTAVTGGGVYVTSAKGGIFMGCIKEASGGVQYETLNSSYGIRHNYASGASSDIEPSSGIPTGFGGGVYSNKATLFVASGTIGYNLAAKGGGAAILGQYQSLGYTPCLDGENSKIEGNKATADGGGLYIKKDTFRIKGSISSNTAGSDGGGVYNYWSDLEISGNGAKINSNKAQNGGGIFIPEDGSEPSGNTSFTNLQNGAQVNSNEATYYGGGIYNYDAALEIHTSNISYNKATNTTSGKGGAMYIKYAGYTRIISGTVTMTPTSGYARQARYNDIYPENSRAFSIYTADATISGKVYITLPSTVAADAEIILILGYAPYTPLQSSTYLLTTGSTYYNVKTINTGTGKLY